MLPHAATITNMLPLCCGMQPQNPSPPISGYSSYAVLEVLPVTPAVNFVAIATPPSSTQASISYPRPVLAPFLQPAVADNYTTVLLTVKLRSWCAVSLPQLLLPVV